jgi:hypothetical protein
MVWTCKNKSQGRGLISNAKRRSANRWLLLVLAVTGSITETHAQSSIKHQGAAKPSTTKITEWQDEASAGIHFLHQIFPDINPRSKIIVLDNQDWRHSPSGLYSFGIFVCEPEPPPTDEQRRDILTRFDIHCSTLTIWADFLMGGSQLGRVPDWILIGRPNQDKHSSELSALLQAHQEWTETQVEDAMRTAGVKYGKGSRAEVIALIRYSVRNLEPFLGRLRIDSIDYSFVRPADGKEFLPPAWRVEAQPLGQDTKKPWTTYVLVFSGFDGTFQSETKFLRLPKSQ